MARPHAPLVWGLAVTETVSFGVLYYAFAVLLVPMQEALGWSRPALVLGFTLAVAVSGLAAPGIGRLLDHGRSRAVLTGGSLAGAGLVAAWSQVRSLAAFYVVFALLGLAMACVLYDAAFTVLARRTAPHHRRAITTVTLVAGLASFVFQPLAGALVDHLGWRDALLVLAIVLVIATTPVHWLVLRDEPAAAPGGAADARPDGRFWRLVASFTLVNGISAAVGVLLLATLVDAGWSLERAAVAGGLLGGAQLPGRLAVGRGAGAPRPRVLAAALAMPGAGVALLLAADGSALVWLAVVVLGAGQGASTLLRATVFADLYGTARIGALNGLAARPITGARAGAPLVVAALVPVLGATGALGVLVPASLAAAAMGGRALR